MSFRTQLLEADFVSRVKFTKDYLEEKKECVLTCTYEQLLNVFIISVDQ